MNHHAFVTPGGSHHHSSLTTEGEKIMNYLAATLHTLGIRLTDTTAEKMRLVKGDRERGSVTIEQVLFAVAVIGFVAIVVAAITAYVRSKAGELAGA